MKDNVIVTKTFRFAVKVVECYKMLCNTSKEYVLSKQLLSSGTSIGANVREAVQAQSKKDFVSKMSISLKEAYETQYWIELLKETEYIDNQIASELIDQLDEIIRILSSIIKSSKDNKQK